MRSIREILLELVSVRSDTGTAFEAAMGKKIYDLILEDPYFQAHPGQCGAEYGSDRLGRPVVWGLKRGASNRTVVLSGHYDAVEIQCYGPLKEWALNPAELKKRMAGVPLPPRTAAALEDENWLFGRGAADMKAGLAINLNALFTLECDASILFTAVCDEENMSQGCRELMPLLVKLRDRFGLDLKLAVITEPQFSSCEDSSGLELYRGGMGKVLPLIVARGKLAHSAENVKGLNAALMISEFAARADIAPELMTSDLGMTVQPPSVQILRDLKTAYDVSLPEYAMAGVSVLFLGVGAPERIMKRMAEICVGAFEAVIGRYNAAFDAALAAGLVEEAARLKLAPRVTDVAELTRLAQENLEDWPGFAAALESKLAAALANGTMSLQSASCAYIQSLIEASGIEGPLMALGIAPPYYPAVSADHMDVDASRWRQSVRRSVQSAGLTLEEKPYVPVMADVSYFSCADPGAERGLMANLALPRSLYDVPFEAIGALNLPCFVFGPRCGDPHQWTERVYMPDVERHVPAALAALVEKL